MLRVGRGDSEVSFSGVMPLQDLAANGLYVYRCGEARAQSLTLLLGSLPPDSSRQDPFLNMKLTGWVSRQAQGSSCLRLTNSVITNVIYHS